jgi:hypothetical protein
MNMPSIIVSTTCVHPVVGLTFNGSYTNIETDPYPNMITDVWKDFIGPTLSVRLILKRVSTYSNQFYIILGMFFYWSHFLN